MYITDFKLVNILKDKMGEEEAQALVEYIEIKLGRIFQNISETIIYFITSRTIHIESQKRRKLETLKLRID